MMYDISIKNFNGNEIFRGQNLTEELTKMVIDKCSNLPMTIWKSPEPEPEKKEERYQAYEDLAFNANRHELAKSCAEFLSSYCDNKTCNTCQFHNDDESDCRLQMNAPFAWKLKEGDSE